MWFNRLFFGLVIGCVLGQSSLVYALQEKQSADAIVQSIQAKLAKQSALSTPNRLEQISAFFLGKPYLLGALGEGMSGEYDQFPLYRADAFDCLTFVETVLAIALTDDLNSFKRKINHIRYQGGKVSFITRNHFTDLDWNSNNQRLDILKDITQTLHDQQGKLVFETAIAEINKPAWYQQFTAQRIRLANFNSAEQERRLQALKKLGQRLMTQTASIHYIPLSVLFDAKGNSNDYLFQQIPNGAIVEIIRPNWDLTRVIGTHLNVSHLGFTFWRDGVLIFRNASTIQGHVVDQPLVDYLLDAFQSPTIKGINIQTVLRPNRVSVD